VTFLKWREEIRQALTRLGAASAQADGRAASLEARLAALQDVVERQHAATLERVDAAEGERAAADARLQVALSDAEARFEHAMGDADTRIEQAIAAGDAHLEQVVAGLDARVEQALADVRLEIARLEAEQSAVTVAVRGVAENTHTLVKAEVEGAAARLDAALNGVAQRVKQVRAGDKERRKQIAALDDDVALVSKEVALMSKEVALASEAVRRIEARLVFELRELRRVKNPMAAPNDAQFLELAEPILITRRTLLGYDRLYVIWQSIGNVRRLKLPAAEIGAYRGGSAFFIASAFRALTGTDAELHVVDTFEGHPDDSIAEHDSERQRGKFTDTSHQEVRDYLAPFPGVTVHKGDARSIFATWPESQFGFVHIDVDLFEATQECLRYFGPRLASGGIIVLDDYLAPSCPGIERAAEQFLEEQPDYQTWNPGTEQLVLIKR
jgi:hypothetical protein